MRLVDTSAWVEWLIGSAPGKALAPRLPPRAEWLVPTIVQLELAKWLTREVDESIADQAIAYSQLCVVVPLDTKVALAAAERCAKNKLATAEAIVYATALEYKADLLTCDAHFKNFPGVVYISNTQR